MSRRPRLTQGCSAKRKEGRKEGMAERFLPSPAVNTVQERGIPPSLPPVIYGSCMQIMSGFSSPIIFRRLSLAIQECCSFICMQLSLLLLRAPVVFPCVVLVLCFTVGQPSISIQC